MAVDRRELADRYVLAAYIGARIAELRKAKGWSQERLGRETEMSRETVRRAEAADKLSEWETLEVMAGALGVTLFDLLPTDPASLRPDPDKLADNGAVSSTTHLFGVLVGSHLLNPPVTDQAA